MRYPELPYLVNKAWKTLKPGERRMLDEHEFLHHGNVVSSSPKALYTYFHIVVHPQERDRLAVAKGSIYGEMYPADANPGAVGTASMSLENTESKFSKADRILSVNFVQTHFKTQKRPGSIATIDRETAEKYKDWRRAALTHAIVLARDLKTVVQIQKQKRYNELLFHRKHPKFLTKFEKDVRAVAKATGAKLHESEWEIVLEPKERKNS